MLKILLILIFFVSGCSSLYYFPVQNHYFISPEKLQTPPEIIKFKSLDGTQLEGWYFKSVKDKPKGFILHFHGNAQNVSTHFTYLWDARQVGYDYFVFDYRGFGNSQGKPTPAGVALDSQAAMHWAEKQRARRGNPPLVYFCQSLGGPICLRAMAREPKLKPAALIIDSSFSSYRSVARSVADGSWLLWALQPIAWLIVDNSESPQDDLESIHAGNTLVVHGDSDTVVNVKHGRHLFKKLPEPKSLWIIDDGQHTDFLVHHHGKYKIKFYAWLDEKLKSSR